MKFGMWDFFFENLSRNFKFHENPPRITGTVHEGFSTFFLQYLAKFFLELEIVWTTVVGRIETHILCSVHFSRKLCRLWDNYRLQSNIIGAQTYEGHVTSFIQMCPVLGTSYYHLLRIVLRSALPCCSLRSVIQTTVAVAQIYLRPVQYTSVTDFRGGGKCAFHWLSIFHPEQQMCAEYNYTFESCECFSTA